MLILLLNLNAVGRPHYDSKTWRILGQMRSIHGTPRQTRGFLLIQKTPRSHHLRGVVYIRIIFLFFLLHRLYMDTPTMDARNDLRRSFSVFSKISSGVP